MSLDSTTNEEEGSCLLKEDPLRFCPPDSGNCRHHEFITCVIDEWIEFPPPTADCAKFNFGLSTPRPSLRRNSREDEGDYILRMTKKFAKHS